MFNICKNIVLVLFYFITLTTNAQVKKDSLLKELANAKTDLKKAIVYYNLSFTELNNNNTRLSYLNKSLQIANKCSKDSLAYLVLINKSNTFQFMFSNNNHDSINAILNYLKTKFPIKDHYLNAAFYEHLGNIEMGGNLKNAIKYFNTAKIEMNQTNLSSANKRSFSNNNIDLQLSYIYLISGEYRKAINYLLPIKISNSAPLQNVNIKIYLANCYLALNNDSCLIYANEGYKLFLENIKDTVKAIGVKLYNIDYYINNKKFTEANESFKSIDQLFEEVSVNKFDPETLKHLYFTRASVLKNKTSLVSGDLVASNFLNAINNFKLAGKICQINTKMTNADLSNLSECYDEISSCYSKINQADSALLYYKKSVYLKDSLRSIQNNKNTKELLTKYDTEKKEAAIALLNEKNKASLAESKKQRAIAIAIIVAALLSIVVLINRYRLKQKANTMLQTQKILVEKSNKELTKRNTLIQQSIEYASIIQKSLLPNETIVKETELDYMVIHQPKELVGGDFYWVHKVKETRKIYIAMIDCTGHGIPGAFMTLLSNSIFNNIIETNTNITAAQFLTQVNTKLHASFNTQKGEMKTSTEGMDVSMICIDYNSNILNYAGAKKPIYIKQKNTGIVELKVDPYSIGYLPLYAFSDYITPIELGDIIYMTTDGFIDQKNQKTNEKLSKGAFMSFLTAICALPLVQQKLQLEQFFNDWKGDKEQLDDVCVLAVKY